MSYWLQLLVGLGLIALLLGCFGLGLLTEATEGEKEKVRERLRTVVAKEER